MVEEKKRITSDERDTNRLEAFSDGVIAVAITLLVLNIKIPEVPSPDKLLDERHLRDFLLNQWPILFAFVTSFLTIGIMWLNHHRVFKHIKRTDTGLLMLNLLLLLTIVFVPVPTALVAPYIIRFDQHIAAIVYSGTFLLMALCFNTLWRYASYHNRLLDKDADQHAVRAISRQFSFGPLLYLIAFGIAWLNGPASVLFQFLLALFFALPGRPARIDQQA
ncbi:MAG TPA: TMEM175 family protein [Ktedonosporobacter sp.]|nr:TMEM175 family protein [Ktedonosporobacter sp.]